ncbi:MAG: mechanosensitive ion channel [Ekhidna sp.]
MEKGARNSIGLITRVMIMFIGSIFIIQSAGIDMSSLSLLAGALGVGIGFGLQNITDNFISGIIILFEKPIKVGDRIVVGDTEGDVINISVRATTILTNENVSIIVPNSEFISSRVINWSHNDRNIRFDIPVGVCYKEDPEEVKDVLLKVADENEHALKHPAPHVFFDEFGDSSLNFTLASWTSTHTDKPRRLKTELYFAIFEKFKEKGIEIPFPQRDVYIKSHVASTPQH